GSGEPVRRAALNGGQINLPFIDLSSGQSTTIKLPPPQVITIKYNGNLFRLVREESGACHLLGVGQTVSLARGSMSLTGITVSSIDGLQFRINVD
ncbi:MAG: hypothetical protein ABIH69_06390, partial [bacterium]